MNLVINGQKQIIKDGTTIIKLLDELKINRLSVAVELNLDIVPKNKYDGTILNEGDKLEIISFVGGG
jgi:thiamine biosynthesis protein ThiS